MATATDSNPAPARAPDRDARLRRRRHIALRLLVVVVVVVAMLAVAWYFFIGRWYESTDDAYVDGNVVQITPQIPGTVISIGADDNDFVRAGEPVVRLDPANADVALAQAEAALAQTVRRVRGLYSAVATAQAHVAVRESELRQAQADYRRRQGLAATGAISREDLAHARDALRSARNALAAAQAQLAAQRAMVEDTRTASHPDVTAAAEKVRAAWLDEQRATLVAPVSGYIAKRTVQVGQRVQPGSPLMAVVPLRQVWVDANFKETQLGRMRIGQPVTLTSDLYGGSVIYHGRIEGLGIGTGSAFSLLPAQNASGNWIKIVQRLPVRITLDPRELDRHPLRIGLSMRVKSDVRNESGPMLASQPPRHPAFSTRVYARNSARVDAIIAKIVRDNGGSAAVAARALAHRPRAANRPPAG